MLTPTTKDFYGVAKSGGTRQSIAREAVLTGLGEVEEICFKSFFVVLFSLLISGIEQALTV